MGNGGIGESWGSNEGLCDSVFMFFSGVPDQCGMTIASEVMMDSFDRVVVAVGLIGVDVGVIVMSGAEMHHRVEVVLSVVELRGGEVLSSNGSARRGRELRGSGSLVGRERSTVAM